MAKVNKTAKKKTPKKGFLNRLFGTQAKKKKPAAKPTLTPNKKATASSKKVIKTPASKKQAPKKPQKKPVSKPVIETRKALPAPVKRLPPAPIKPLKPPPPKELVVESSYTPEPFRGSSFILKPHKVLTAEGWKRLVEYDSPFPG